MCNPFAYGGTFGVAPRPYHRGGLCAEAGTSAPIAR